MRTGFRLWFLTACFLPVDAQASWEPVQREQPYKITGQTGAELYASIGERGPKIGIARAVAVTNFKLTWARKYVPQGNACVLVSARPKLTITYTLPKPSGHLPAALGQNWETFISGVRRHEKVHGDIIEKMVRNIEAATVGLSVAGDPSCSKIRTEMTRRLSALSLAQRQASRDFDQIELSEGGAVHQLILQLVNGQ